MFPEAQHHRKLGTRSMSRDKNFVVLCMCGLTSPFLETSPPPRHIDNSETRSTRPQLLWPRPPGGGLPREAGERSARARFPPVGSLLTHLHFATSPRCPPPSPVPAHSLPALRVLHWDGRNWTLPRGPPLTPSLLPLEHQLAEYISSHRYLPDPGAGWMKSPTFFSSIEFRRRGRLPVAVALSNSRRCCLPFTHCPSS